MKQLIFYGLLALFVGGAIASFSHRSPTPASAVTTAALPDPSAVQGPPSSSAATVLPEEAYGKYGKMSLPALETAAKAAVDNWAGAAKSNKAMTDEQVAELTLSLDRAAQGTKTASQDEALISQLHALVDKRGAAQEAASQAKAVADDVEGRTSYASRLEDTYLQQGMDVSVTATGTKSTTLTLKYVLMGRPTVYQIGNDGAFKATLVGLGFKTVVFSDGYDSTWRLDLLKDKFL